MGSYFLDSSAIIKRYIPEQGRVWIATLCNPAHGHKSYISQATLVEVVAGICRRAREQSITIADLVALPTFVCADNNLLDIALAEGLSVENPNNYS